MLLTQCVGTQGVTAIRGAQLQPCGDLLRCSKVDKKKNKEVENRVFCFVRGEKRSAGM